MHYIAVRTKKNHYKFINITKIKQQAEDVAAVFMIFAVVYMLMFI